MINIAQYTSIYIITLIAVTLFIFLIVPLAWILYFINTINKQLK